MVNIDQFFFYLFIKLHNLYSQIFNIIWVSSIRTITKKYSTLESNWIHSGEWFGLRKIGILIVRLKIGDYDWELFDRLFLIKYWIQDAIFLAKHWISYKMFICVLVSFCSGPEHRNLIYYIQFYYLFPIILSIKSNTNKRTKSSSYILFI